MISSQEVHELVTSIVERFPENTHAIITTRSDPPLPLARWRVRGRLAEIRTADLSFTVGETADFFENAAGIVLAPNDLITIEDRTESRITGLKLAALSLQGRSDVSRFINTFSGSHHYIMDHLAQEALNHQPEDVKTLLL